MARNRLSAKQAGTRFEAAVAAYLKRVISHVHRKARTGAKDTGDVGGAEIRGSEVVIECKSTARMDLPAWLREAEVERENAGAGFGVVIHKRHGVGLESPDAVGQQYVTMTLATFRSILKHSSP